MPVVVGFVGGLLVLLAAGAAWYTRNQRRLLRSVTHAPALTVEEVLAEQSAGEARVRCTITGRAAAGPSGLLAAHIGGHPCVWQRFEEWQHWARGTTHPSRWRRRVDAGTSTRPFALDDGTGQALIDPTRASLDGIRLDVHRTDRNDDRDSDFLRKRRTGYEVRSWVIRPGEVLTAVGAVMLRHGVPVLTGAAGLTPLVTTSSVEAFTRHTRWRTQAALAVAVLAATGAVAAAGWMFLLANSQ